MKKIASTLLLLLGISITYAQEGAVTIEQDEKIDKLLDIYKDFNNSNGFYTIQIYSSTNSHQGAKNAKAKAAENFPGWPSSLDFIRQSYKVTIGRFDTYYEAQQKFALVKKKYPNALLIKPKKK